MATLYTLAYPSLAGADAEAIEAIRREHDPQSGMVRAHFTLVFGCDAVAVDDYARHVRDVSRSTPAVSFDCRYAMLNADARSGLVYVYLVPDEGYSGLSRLHDALYRGPLARHLRMDIPFVPHITLGVFHDKAMARSLCDQLNEHRFAVSGMVNTLSVVQLEPNGIRGLAAFQLAG